MHDYVIILASAPIVYVQCGFNECYKMPLEPPYSIFNNNNIYIYYDEDFATCWFQKVLVVIKILDIKRYVCNKTYLYDISRDFSSSLEIEMYGWPFCSHAMPT